jgi:hypothetical protein
MLIGDFTHASHHGHTTHPHDRAHLVCLSECAWQIVLTCFVSNKPAQHFFREQHGFKLADHSPDDECYTILCKNVAAAALSTWRYSV